MLMPLPNKEFIEEEFIGLDLGDERLNKRVLKVGELINGNPSLSFPNASRAVNAELKAFYRFFQNEKTTDQKLLSTHYYNTIQRCLECNDRILLITDSTFASPAKSKTMDGLKDMGKGKGNMLRIHYMIAVQESNGEVLGITDFRVIGKDLQQTDISLEDESDVWKLVATATVRRIKDSLGEKEGAKLISLCTYVADREGDDFDLFSCLNVLKLNFVIRSQYDRKVEHREENQKISVLEYKEVKHGDIYEVEVQEKDGSKRVATVQKSILEECKVFSTGNQSKEEALILNIVSTRDTFT